jgi:cobalt/nickel transport system permease protein
MPDLRGLDPRARVAAALAFALAVVALERLEVAAFALGAAVVGAVLFRVPPRAAARRLVAAQASLLLVVATLPFSIPGESVFRLGPLGASDAGVHRAALVALKANAILVAVLGILGTLDASGLGHALYRLRAPAGLVHLLLFTVRYLGLLEAELARLRTALRARAFRPRSDRHTLRSLGQLAGMLIVRSHARAERVMEAMRCRGFTGRFHVLDDLRWRAADGVFAAALCLGIAGLLAADRW